MGGAFPAQPGDEFVAEHCGVEPDALGAVSIRVGELGLRANPVWSAAQAQIAARGRACGGGVLGSGFVHGRHGFVGRWATVAAPVGAKDHDAKRLRYTRGCFPAMRAGLGVGYLIIGSGLVRGFSDGSFVFSMCGVDDDGAVVVAVTVRERN